MFLPPSSQPQNCTIYGYTGVATTNVSDVLVDCQHNDWTWKSWFIPTTNQADQYASVTTPRFPPNQLPPADISTPGGRDFAMTWTDNQGRKWLFGGFGYPYPAPLGKQLPGLMNDLWVYDVTASPPAWVPANLPTYLPPGGTAFLVDPTSLEATELPSVYGARGVYAATNAPGARWGGVTWTDGSGNLWMFGGQGDVNAVLEEGLLSDLWEWIPGAPDANGAGTYTGKWIWQGGYNAGDQPGSYGTLGTSAPMCNGSNAPCNIPGARWAAAYTVDQSGTNLYVFGGQGHDSTGNIGFLNDLWKYNIGSGQWTWLGPSNSNTVNHNGLYGTQGTTAAGNFPGGRQAATLWVDSSGTVWLFGGFGLDSAGTGAPNGSTLNDLWKFDGTNWTWVSGGGATGIGDQNGSYGTQATSNLSPGAAGNVPGSRWGAVGWTQPDGDLFLYGGWGYGSNATLPTGFLDDIWEYDHTSGQWIWWKGTSNVNQSSAYLNTQGLAYVKNVAGGRRGVAMWQPDSLGYIWMFGGEGYDATSGAPPGYLDDLWTYLPFP
jgi:hypothetical protein